VKLEAKVPLSDEEQRLLEQMERALAADDPKFASTLSGSRLLSRNRRRALAGVLGFVLGLALLMIGVIVPMTVVSVGGFVVMLASAYVALTYWRKGSEPEEMTSKRPANVTPIRRSGSGSSQRFMDRIEARWRRRRDSGF
jgi:hypothetical protein